MMKMKTWGLIGIVVALHCVVIGSVFFISGCGTTPKPEPLPVMPDMPPPMPPKVMPEVKPIKKTMKAAPAKKEHVAGGGVYIVQAGDSLSVIAKRCRVTQAELVEANKLADPNKIRIGQKLILPARGQLPPAVPKPAVKAKAKTTSGKSTATSTLPAGENEYIVKPGDCLSKIAAQYGVKTSALREVNKLTSDKLMIGQKLMLPGAKKTMPASTETPVLAPSATVDMAPDVVEPAPPPALPPATTDTELMSVDDAAGHVSPIFSSGVIHTVQVNEDLGSIAKLYAVSVEEIVELNQLSTNRTVQIGQRVKIP